MNKSIALLLAFLLMMGLTACKPEDAPIQPDSTPPSEPEIEVIEPNATLPPSAPVTESPEDPADYIIDDALLREHSQAIEQIWPASDDRLLVFTSTLSGGYVSEQINLYIYDLNTCAFTGD
ncbi:MAG: hypothetical protein IIV85_04700, partial [Clostridia bacterium]|nr:hypothetical protein [Clostridia bacterium]